MTTWKHWRRCVDSGNPDVKAPSHVVWSLYQPKSVAELGLTYVPFASYAWREWQHVCVGKGTITWTYWLNESIAFDLWRLVTPFRPTECFRSRRKAVCSKEWRHCPRPVPCQAVLSFVKRLVWLPLYGVMLLSFLKVVCFPAFSPGNSTLKTVIPYI